MLQSHSVPSRSSYLGTAWLALAFAAPLFVAAPAAAQEACGDTTCPAGYTCKTVEGACDNIACREGTDCTAPCEQQTYQFCAPKPCNTNADCGGDTVCYEHERKNCSGVAVAPCPPGAECAPPDAVPEPTCEVTSERICTPRSQLPCQVDADCGAGFTCEEVELCSGGSSSGTPMTAPAPGAGTPGFAPPEGRDVPPEKDPAEPTIPMPTVTCEPSGEFRCVMIKTACTADADCPAGWSCKDNPEGVCWSGPDGEGCQPADPAKLCMPPYYDLGGGRGVAEDGSTKGPGSPDIPVPAAGQDNGGELAGTPDPSPAPPSGVPQSTSQPNASSGGGGCSVSPASTPLSGYALLALGFASLLRMRRRRG